VTSDSPAAASPPGSPAAAGNPLGPLLRLARRFPATYGLIALTLLVFAGQWLSTQLVGFDLVLSLGAKVNQAIAAGQIWRLVTPLFVHAGLLHIAVNMYSLYAIGPAVERFFGSQRMLVIYLLSGIVGVDFSLGLSPNPSVGASGAIFGLLGALATLLFMHRHIFGRMGTMQFRQLVLVALLNLALGLSPGIDNWGHVGGLIGGTLLTLALGPRFSVSLDRLQHTTLVDRQPWETRRAAALLALAAAGALAMAAIYSPLGA
jgi:rhomboid protease GluP